jgi:hypothetical protein
VETGPPLARPKGVKDDITIILLADMAEATLNGAGRVFDANHNDTEDDRMIFGRMTAVWPDYAEADAEVAKLAESAHAFLEQNRVYIERVARELLAKETLSGDDVRRLRPPAASL